MNTTHLRCRVGTPVKPSRKDLTHGADATMVTPKPRRPGSALETILDEIPTGAKFDGLREIARKHVSR